MSERDQLKHSAGEQMGSSCRCFADQGPRQHGARGISKQQARCCSCPTYPSARPHSTLPLTRRASVRLQRTQRRCWQVQAEERPDSDPHSPDRAVSRNQEPQGSTVVLYASALLLIAFVVPRIVTMGMLGIERSLVTTLLGFEELLTQALFSAAKWVGIALLFAFTLNVFVAILQAAFNRRE